MQTTATADRTASAAMNAVDQLSEARPDDPRAIRARFDENGYVVVRGLLDPIADLGPVLDEYAALLDRLAADWHAAGELSSLFEDLPFESRLISVIGEVGPKVYDYFRIFFNPPSRTTADSAIHYGPAIFGLLRHPRLLDAMEAILGPEITLTPVNIVRIKAPERRLPKNKKHHIGMAATYWHQDEGTFSEDISEKDILTCWVPLTDALKEMGCLQVVPGSHRGPLCLHCANPDAHRTGIPELELGPVRHYVAMKAGDVHFHHRRLQHGSLPNVSDRLRFSFDLRYVPTPQATGACGGVPVDYAVPGVVVRSRRNPADEMRDWQDWRAYQEAMRAAFMSVDWKNRPAVSQFRSDHPYCL